MDTLDLLLRDEENYKQGVYWCIRRGTAVSSRLASLLRRDRVYLVEIDGFDEFMADLHREAHLALPRAIARPFEIASERAKLFVDVRASLSGHPVIRSDISEVLGSLEYQSPKLPPSMEAAALTSRQEYDLAAVKWEEAHKEDPQDDYIALSYGEALVDAGRSEELVEFIPASNIPAYNKTYLLLRAGRNEEVISVATETLTGSAKSASGWSDDDAIALINRAIALKRLGRRDEMTSDLDFLEENGDTDEPRFRAGVAALRGDKEAMLAALNEAVPRTISPDQLRVFPVFEDYRDDPDFINILRSYNS